MTATVTLVLGGSRSGKSALAERLADALPAPVSYLATGVADPDDADFAARVERHRARRPAAWRTVEVGADLVTALDATEGSVLVDSIGTWVSAHQDFAVDVDALVDVLGRRAGTTILVSDEVGMGVHPSTDVGRRFRDALGDVNARLAEVADDVLLVVAGRVLPLERGPA
jgi:adenosyl cobinamide kinase/adenosyl cobinamide phosphate guanylyltransferase